MVKRLNMTGQTRGGPLGVQTVLRLMTILIVIIGVAYLGPIYYKRMFRAKPEPAQPTGTSPGSVLPRVAVDNDAGEVTYDIDLRRFRLSRSADNAPVPAVTDDNAAEVAAIVGLDAIRDGAAIEPQPLYYLLREAETRRPADDLFMKRAPVVTLAELRAEADKFRCKPVVIRGTVNRVERSTLPENPSGIRQVLEGELVVGREGLCMFLTTRVGPLSVGQDVELRGLFMKLVTYASRGGGQDTAPLVIASHPVFLRTGKTASGGRSWDVLLTVLMLLAVIYLVMIFVLRRRQRSRNVLLEARRKARSLTAAGRTPEEVQEDQETKEP